MSIVNLAVDKLISFCKDFRIEGLFVAGDYCRSAFLDQDIKLNKIEVVSAIVGQSSILGSIFATEVLNVNRKQQENVVSMIYTVNNESVLIEFQDGSTKNYLQNIEIQNWLKVADIANPLLLNLYGRSFTLNALILSLENENIYDPTTRAKPDIDNEVIISLLPPALLIKYYPIAILESIELSVLYDFHIQQDLRDAISSSTHLLSECLSVDRIQKEILRILKIDPKNALNLFEKLNLGQFINSRIREKIDD